MSLLCIKYMLSGHSAAHEIKHIWKLTSGFFGPQILNFERSFSLYPGPQSSLVLPCKFSLWWPCPTSMKTINNILFRQIINLLPHYCCKIVRSSILVLLPLLTDLTPLHLCACPQQGLVFSTSNVVGFLCSIC